MTTKNPWELEEDVKEDESTTSMSIEAQKKKTPAGVYDLPDLPTVDTVLIDSDKHDYGEVRVVIDLFDTHYKEGELIGTWTRAPFDKLIHVDFTTPLDALRDRGIQVRALHVRKRAARKEGKEEVVVDRGEVEAEFNDLRAKLKQR